MTFAKHLTLMIIFAMTPAVPSQEPVVAQKGSSQNGMPSSGGYEPSSTSLMRLLESDHAMNDALMTFARTGNRNAYRASVLSAAQEGSLAAELLLADQYIPEQCTFEPNQDVPHCGKNGNETPTVVFRQNPLDIEASYEEASKWLERASAQGSGEASEVLAQLITRMKANGHHTPYTEADSAHFHALARIQEFDVEAISVTCYKRNQNGSSVTVDRLPDMPAGAPHIEPFSPEDLTMLKDAGLTGELQYEGGAGGGESVLLTRPEGQTVNVRLILDHAPSSEVLLPMPAHHDEIYVQRGDQFLAFPSGGKVLPRYIDLEPPSSEMPRQVSVFTQMMDGGHSGGSCVLFSVPTQK